MKPTNRNRVPRAVAWTFAALFLGVSLLPFAFVGETWGMVWFYVAAPFSLAVEATIGMGQKSYFLVGATSVACAAMWGGLGYVLGSLVERWLR